MAASKEKVVRHVYALALIAVITATVASYVTFIAARLLGS